MKYIIKAVGMPCYWAGMLDWVDNISLAQQFNSRQEAARIADRATSIEYEIIEIA